MTNDIPIISKYTQKDRGERRDYKRLGVMIDPDLLNRLKLISIELERRGYKDYDISSLIRVSCHNFIEEVNEYFMK